MDKMHSWYSSGLSLDQNMLELASKLEKRGYKTAVLSNTIPPYLDVWREGIQKYIPFILASCEIGHKKPDFYPFNEVQRRLELKREEGIFVDNDIEFLRSARICGLVPIHFTNYEQVRYDIGKLGVEI